MARCAPVRCSLHIPQESDRVILLVSDSGMLQVAVGTKPSARHGIVSFWELPLAQRDPLLELLPRIVHVQVYSLAIAVMLSRRTTEDEIVSEMHEPRVDKGEVDVKGDHQDGEEEDKKRGFIRSASSGEFGGECLPVSGRQVCKGEGPTGARWRREQRTRVAG